MKKIRKGYKNWLVIDIAHYLKKKNIKTKSMAKIIVRTSLRKTQNIKKYVKKLPIKYVWRRQTKKEKYMKEYRKTFQQKKTFIEKVNENNELQSVEVDVVTNFIKDEVESSSDAEVYNNDDYDSEKDRVTGFR